MELEITLSIIGFLILSIVILIPLAKTIAPIFPYAYTNARLRAMRTQLLSKKDYEELIKKPYTEIIYALGRKNYPDLSKRIGVDTTYASVESAFRSQLIQRLEKIKHISPQQSKPFVKALLAKYDIQLIQSIVRTTTTKYSVKRDIYHQSTLFTKDFLTKEQPTIDDLYNQLKGTRYEEILTKHQEALKKKQFKAFEEELDLYYFKKLLRSAKTIEAKTYTKMLIDRHNISLVLRGETALIPNGRIPLEKIKGTKETGQITKLIAEHGYNTQNKEPELIERDLARAFKKKGELFMSKNPLSEATIIGYIILLTTDIRTLNILLKMKYHEFDNEKIREVNLL